MNKSDKNTAAYIEELEDKIMELNFKLKNTSTALSSAGETHRQTIRKLAHNLKNPVGIIYSFSGMILEDSKNYTTEKLEKHLTIINNSAEFSMQLLNKFAKYSSLQSLDLSFNFKKIDYIDLLNNVINQLQDAILEKSITIIKEFDTDEIFLVLDEVEISLAMSNILGNAIRYSNEDATITISVIEKSENVETVISDEGIGISEKDLPFILNEFHVVNTYSKDGQKCIGLGLTIANKIVELHKGKITVSSTVGKGSNFKMILPKN